MRLVLLHYHILKNGGSSIMEILGRSFLDRFAAYDLAGLDAEIMHRDLLSFLESNPRVQALSSHQIFYPVPRAPGYLFFDICFLRDPIDRIRSIYDYFRAKPVEGETMSGLAYERTLGDFTRRLVEEMPWTINDVQVNLLANGLINDQPRGIEDLAVATARMLETSFLGVVDRFDESLVAGQHALERLFPALNCVHAPVNASATPGTTLAQRTEQFRSACDEGVFSELLRLNAMDFELLRRARAEVRRRFDLVPEPEEQLRGLQQGVSLLLARAQNENGRPGPASEPVFQPVITTERKTRARNIQGAPAPGVFTRLTRWLRFVTNPARMRPGSAFRRLFDAEYYRQSYADVASSGANPLWHFVLRGVFEGRNPHPLFDTKFYLSQSPRPASVNALCDYLERGDAEGRPPHPLFDVEYYAGRYPDVRQARMNSLLHYILHGAAEGRKPHRLFQHDHYLTACAPARRGNPLVHFVESEPSECFNPHPLFDCKSYLRAHPEMSGNPLVHYVTRRADSESTCVDSPGAFDTARFTIQEVDVLAIFPDSGFAACPEEARQGVYDTLQACAQQDGFSGEIALVWEDAAGAKKVLCAPQQRPFFECLRYDQLSAQINGKLT